MANYKTPGVYDEEISKLPASVAPVATAIPAFIGYTEKSEKNGEPLATATPVRIMSLLEYEEIFGGAFNEKLSVTLTGGSVAEVDTIITVAAASQLSPYTLYNNLVMYFGNGGGPCYIVSVGIYTYAAIPADASTLIDVDNLQAGLVAVETEDEVTLLVVPEAIVLNSVKRKIINDNMLVQCNKLQDRFAIMDAAVLGDTANDDGIGFRGDVGADYLKYGASYYPSLKTIIELNFKNSDVVITDNRAGGTFTGGKTLEDVQNGNEGDKTLYNNIVKEIKKKFEVTLYPSSAMAGVFARVDLERGVWKAPVHVNLHLVKDLSVMVTDEQLGNLNIDATTGKSINVIRKLAGKGVIVWGARTLAGNDNEWRYVSVRRLSIFIEKSVKKATEFVVFEPNDANTWLRTKTMIENFLITLWRDGALAGASPEDAFFVKVGLGETMTTLDILEGRLNIEIGLTADKPAEFIILKISHKMQES